MGDEEVLWRSRVHVFGWKNGKFNARHPVALGVRVGQENVKRFFDKNSNVILVEVGDEAIQVHLTKTFWTTCPELRSFAIGAWLRKKRLAPWLKGRPPEMRLTPIGKNRFRLDA
jgi:hypothetical protein